MKKGQKTCSLWRDASGGVRAVWRLLIGAAAYLAALYGVLGGIGWLFGRLFDAWGLTDANLGYAPRWAQLIVAGHTGFAYALAYLASIAAALFVARRLNGKRSPEGLRLWKALAAGVGLGAALTVLALLPDSMRMETPPAQPTLYIAQPAALAVLILGRLSAETLTRRVVFDAASARGRLAAYAAGCAATTLLTAVWQSPWGIVNAALLGLVGCALYEKGGLAASAAFSAGWTAWCALIVRFPGMSASAKPVYALYHVSDGWLTGGNLGPACGAWMTLLCLAVLGWMFAGEIRSGIARLRAGRRRKARAVGKTR